MTAPRWELDLGSGPKEHSTVLPPANEAGIWELSLDQEVKPVKIAPTQENHSDRPAAAPTQIQKGESPKKTEETKRDPVFEEPDEPLQ